MELRKALEYDLYKGGLFVIFKKLLAVLVIIVFIFTIFPTISVEQIKEVMEEGLFEEIEAIIEIDTADPSDLENEMLAYVNEARKEEGLVELRMNNDLVSVARLKSQDMIDEDYFEHESPTYGSPFEMMENHGVFFSIAGENLAGHYSIRGAHEGLMNSPGHRENILNSSFTEVGIGVVKGGPYKMMITQMFIGR